MLEILVVDDVPTVRQLLSKGLERLGHRVATASDAESALAKLSTKHFDLLLSDISLPGMNGLNLMNRARAISPETDVILITANGVVADAVAALKGGAFDYLTKPFSFDEIANRVGRIDERRNLKRELAAARSELAKLPERSGMVGQSLDQLLQRIATLASSDAPALITGESGTGKELVAQAFHRLGPRSSKPFVAVSCAAFPETLLEAEMFGYEQGAFTGATKRREGRLAAAAGGTLFLDEVAEIPLSSQSKLLRVIQEGEFQPLGTNQSIKADVRIISATHRDLKARIAEGHFREDLYYRLNVLQVQVPPLRERKGDLPLLIEHFIKRFAPPGTHPTISPRVWAVLNEYRFPGNIRELEHAIHQAVVLAQGKEIELDHLPPAISSISGGGKAESIGFATLADATDEFEREYLQRALRMTAGKKAHAAQILAVSRKTLWQKLKKHGLSTDDDDDGALSDSEVTKS